MAIPVELKPADPGAVAEALSHALRFDGRRRVDHADAVMPRVTAERLLARPSELPSRLEMDGNGTRAERYA